MPTTPSSPAPRLADELAPRLLELVRARGLEPGERLPAERQLAEELGVSRPSLREAIQKLASQGVLTSRRGDGTYLQQSTATGWVQDAMDPLATLLQDDPGYRYDVLEARHALESSTAWHAALRATPEDKARIVRCFDVMTEHQQRGDARASAHADAQFHLAIAEASHNLVLQRMMQAIFQLLLSTVAQNRRTMLSVSTPEIEHLLTQQHQALLQAILDGDAARARDAIGQHLEYVRTTVQRLDEDAARRERSSRLPTELAMREPRNPHTA